MHHNGFPELWDCWMKLASWRIAEPGTVTGQRSGSFWPIQARMYCHGQCKSEATHRAALKKRRPRILHVLRLVYAASSQFEVWPRRMLTKIEGRYADSGTLVHLPSHSRGCDWSTDLHYPYDYVKPIGLYV